MFNESAHLYDLIYRHIKNYGEETGKIVQWIEKEHPPARTILDVGCGTGEHALGLASNYGYAVDGIDIEPAFVEIAHHKNPQGLFTQADMMDFTIDKSYDVILCLFSSIGYVKTLENVEKSLLNFRDHMSADGILLLEPWIEPQHFDGGRVYMHTCDSDEIKICRMSHSKVKDRISELYFEYLIGDQDGIKRLNETHELGLFTREEMEDCFKKAGFTVKYDEAGLTGRGLYVGMKS